MPVVYRSGLTDSSRWAAATLRPGDIVISTPSKCGTTWMQMICALLIFQSVELPAALTTLSPWLDMRLRPLPEVLGLLEGQNHRRFIKTHTPLDGLPQVDGVHYVVVGRDPRDVAVSMDRHRANLNITVIESLSGSPAGPGPSGRSASAARPADLRERVMRWIRDERPPAANLDSLRALVWHLAGAWARRQEPMVTLVHFDDLRHDLEGRMRYLAARLDIAVAEALWPALVEAASFDRMRAGAADLAPDERLGLFSDPQAFFRSGTSGQWRGTLTEGDLGEYRRLIRSLASPDFIGWIERGR
ncbi:sulfotransferase domain-containing protein [Actinoplanes sp. M2I2]|uniref:sulfotransferase domain-containing protein n=1 Tax=Actinoplanes sp. M2I2 TaxID=1734444 RepID=UPI00202248A7|nr:sulfotransferase domain-containing protein [Actinoplanes sp. M2I2]